MPAMWRIGVIWLLSSLAIAFRAAAAEPPAKTVRHWGFEPIRKVSPPPDPIGWSRGPIDAFVRAKLSAEGIEPAPRADKRILIRRAFFDLAGLPPSPEDVREFLSDESPDAFEKLLDRLLASPAFGERQGRRWMDVVRYADTAGDNADYPIPEAALYRDWIIDSFNADKPYDEFVREQLAGDVLAAEGPAALRAGRIVATGFIALSRRYATAPFELMHLTIEDTIETTGRAFLGLTLRCARCHDHKTDPVTLADYYGLYGIFASTVYPYAGSEEFASKSLGRSGFVSLLPPAETVPRVECHLTRMGAAEEALRRAEEAKKPKEELEKLRGELRSLRRSNLPRDLPAAYAAGEGTPADARIQELGDPGRPGRLVPRGIPRFLSGGESPAIAPSSSGRLELARWVTSRESPLAARVMANRVWQSLFGRGIVSTPSNFGRSGEGPTHPELLDWLAAEFVEGGWSMKALYRAIARSRTYQLSSDGAPVSSAKDPSNRGFWRRDRTRLDAEPLRDAMLATAGELDLSRPGAHPFPGIDSWSWTQHNPFKAVYPSRRRSVYLMQQRIQRHPFCALFDGPDTNGSTESRTQSIVPQQALFFLNNPFVDELALALARRLVRSAETAPERVQFAFDVLLSRPPRPDETEAARRHVERASIELQGSADPKIGVELEAWKSLVRVLFASNEFVSVD